MHFGTIACIKAAKYFKRKYSNTAGRYSFALRRCIQTAELAYSMES